MPHYYPITLNGGRSLAGDSLGFHAYSLRIDNLTNQWLLEETSMSWIPPYSLGMCLRLYGTGVAIILNQAPVGQPQLQPIPGEQSVGVYSDQLRTEVGGQAVRQFTTVLSVSDLTWGPQPSFPPTGTSRLYADPNGQLNYLLPSGVNRTLIDTANYGTQALGGDLFGQINAGHIGVQYNGQIQGYDNNGTLRSAYAPVWTPASGYATVFWQSGNGPYWFCNQGGGTLASISTTGILTANQVATGGNLIFNTASGYLQWPNGSYISLNANTVIISGGSPAAGLSTNNLSAGNGSFTGPVSSSSGFTANGDWMRCGTDGQGIYNNANGNGMYIRNTGLFEYSSGAVLLTMARINVGDIVNAWWWVSAPSGSTTSGTATYLPAPFNGMTMTGHTGGRTIMFANFAFINGSAGGGNTLSLYVNYGDQNMRSQMGGLPAAGFMQHSMYQFGAGSIAAGNPHFEYTWALSGAGSIAMNTGIYSSVLAVEFKK